MSMATKTNFTPEEWKLLLESPMMTSMAITAAEPSGLWGMIKESFASASELAKAASDPGANPLVKAVASDFTTSEGRSTAGDDLKAKLAGSKVPGSETSRKLGGSLGGVTLVYKAGTLRTVRCLSVDGVPVLTVGGVSIMSELAAWDSFYVIVGSAAGALIGLQFVVLTLIAARPPIPAADAGAAFATPTIVHFGAALLLSALLRVPWPTITFAAVPLGLVGVSGAVYLLIV